MRENSVKTRGKIWYYSLHNFFSLLDRQKTEYAVIKGEALSLYAYNMLGARKSNDIDILVRREDIDLVDKLLRAEGFIQINGRQQTASRAEIVGSLINSHQTLPYVKSISPYGLKVEIDVNLEVMWGEWKGRKIEVDEFLRNVERTNIYGENVNVLAPHYAFVHLLLHNYKDCNSIYILATRNSINYMMFLEVYLFWKNFKDFISIDWLVKFVGKYEIGEYLYYILFYTNSIYGDKEMGNYVNALESKKGRGLLNCYGLNDAERKEWKVPFRDRLMEENQLKLLQGELSKEDIRKIDYNKKMF